MQQAETKTVPCGSILCAMP